MRTEYNIYLECFNHGKMDRADNISFLRNPYITHGFKAGWDDGWLAMDAAIKAGIQCVPLESTALTTHTTQCIIELPVRAMG